MASPPLSGAEGEEEAEGPEESEQEAEGPEESVQEAAADAASEHPQQQAEARGSSQREQDPAASVQQAAAGSPRAAAPSRQASKLDAIPETDSAGRPAAAGGDAPGTQQPEQQAQHARPEQAAATETPQPAQLARPLPQRQAAQQQHQQQQQAAQQQAGSAPQVSALTSEDVEPPPAVGAAAILFRSRCQWVTPKRLVPGQLLVTPTDMHFVGDVPGGGASLAPWMSGGRSGAALYAPASGGQAGSDGDGGNWRGEGEGLDDAAPRTRHRRWALEGMTEVHHRWGAAVSLARSGRAAKLPCSRLARHAAHALCLPSPVPRCETVPGRRLADAGSPAPASSPLRTLPAVPCSRYLLQPTALECFMADRCSHALFNMPSNQERPR